jgi:hypothetical protein
LLHVFGVGEGNIVQGLGGKTEGLGVDVWNAVQGIIRKSDWSACTEFTYLRIEMRGGFCGHGAELCFYVLSNSS